MCLYRQVEKKWKREAVIPYNYEMTLIDTTSAIFLSDNFFCDMTFRCIMYTEFNQLVDNAFKEIVSYTGFDNYFYCDGLLNRARIDELSSFKGDTITKKYFVSNYLIEGNKLKSFDLEQEVQILEDWDFESGLSTKDYKTVTKVTLQE